MIADAEPPTTTPAADDTTATQPRDFISPARKWDPAMIKIAPTITPRTPTTSRIPAAQPPRVLSTAVPGPFRPGVGWGGTEIDGNKGTTTANMRTSTTGVQEAGRRPATL